MTSSITVQKLVTSSYWAWKGSLSVISLKHYTLHQHYHGTTNVTTFEKYNITIKLVFLRNLSTEVQQRRIIKNDLMKRDAQVIIRARDCQGFTVKREFFSILKFLRKVAIVSDDFEVMRIHSRFLAQPQRKCTCPG